MSDGTGDGALAWRALRHVPDYREAWRRHAAAGAADALELGPFRIRVQSEADIDAARFGLLAWQDPHDADGPVSPFWRQEGMIEGLVEAGAPPLAEVAAAGGAVEGLRLLGGDLVLKVERFGAAVQVRVRDAPRFPEGGGLSVKHGFGLEMPVSMRRILDFWSVAGRAGPRKGRARRAGGPGTACRRPSWRASRRAGRTAGSRRGSGARRPWPESGARTAGCVGSCGGGSGRRRRCWTADGGTSCRDGRTGSGDPDREGCGWRALSQPVEAKRVSPPSIRRMPAFLGFRQFARFVRMAGVKCGRIRRHVSQDLAGRRPLDLTQNQRLAQFRPNLAQRQGVPFGIRCQGWHERERKLLARPAAMPQYVLPMNLYATRTYERAIRKLLSEDARRDKEAAIVAAPDVALVIRGTGGIRKLRWAGSGRGKRGGIRAMYF